MASVSTFDLTRFTALASGDVIAAVDISNTSQNAHGSLLSITIQNLFATIPVPVVVTSASATAFAVGLAGATNPAFGVDASTALQVAGLKVVGAVTTGTVAIVVTDSGAVNTNLTINALNAGTIGIGSVSTGRVTITPVTTITGALTQTGLATFNGGATIASGQTLTVTGATITGAPTWSSSQAITISTATQASITTMANLTTVGALNAGSITSGFGSIDVGADAISGGTGTFTTIAVTAGQKVTLDPGNDSYLISSTPGTVRMVGSGASVFTANTTGLGMVAGAKLYFDGIAQTGDNYAYESSANVLTFSATGGVVGTAFRTGSGSTSVPTATPTTLFALPGVGAFLVFCYDAAIGTGATATAVYNCDGTNVVSSGILSGPAGTFASFSNSGLNVQITHTMGSTKTVNWSYLRIN